MAKISTFLIAFALIGIVIGVLTIFYAEMADNYSQTYANSTFNSYDKLDDLREQTKDINQTLQKVKNTEETNILSFASAFIASGWKVLKTTFTSFDLFTDMSEEAIDQASLGESGGYFKSGLFLIGFLIFAFSIIAVLIGREI